MEAENVPCQVRKRSLKTVKAESLVQKQQLHQNVQTAFDSYCSENMISQSKLEETRSFYRAVLGRIRYAGQEDKSGVTSNAPPPFRSTGGSLSFSHLFAITAAFFLSSLPTCTATAETSTGKFSSESWRVVLILTGTVFAIIGLMIVAAAISAYKTPILNACGCVDPKVDAENEEEEEEPN